MHVCPQCGEENPRDLAICRACGAQLAVAPPERRKLATLLFCDVTGSTEMGERLDPETVRELMMRYFHEMRGAIERHGGTVEKFAGDAVMAAFGVPTAHEDDALRAVRAAAEMRDRLTQLNPMLERSYGALLAMRIGLNTGEVVTGSAAQRETFVTGDAVNTAARLEQAAARDEILLGELTYELARDALHVEALEPIEAKGKSEPVAVYRLLSVASGTMPTRRPKTPLTGRTVELAQLERLFEQAVQDKRCVLATIIGEPGVGKTRLATELSTRVSGRATVHTGHCLSYGEGITYWPLAEFVKQAASIHDGDTSEQAEQKIRGLVEPSVAERIATAVGVSAESFSADDIAWAFGRLFDVLAAPRPLLALIEDLHWAEGILLDLFERLSARSQAPILLVCTARPELVHARADWPVALELEPLAHHEIEGLIKPYELPDHVRMKVAESARGNPLFAEELAAYVQERPDTDATPSTIQALLSARLDLLTESERVAAERGSIEGELFHRGPLTDLSGPEATGTSLEGLVERGLIAPAQATFAGEAAYRFKHVLVRDAVYNGTPKRLRAELHERFADWLERTAGPRVTEYEEILGYHLEQAYRLLAELGPIGDKATALARRGAEHLISSGHRAIRRGDDQAAANLLGRAAALLPPDDPARLKFIDLLGMSLQMIGEYEYADSLLGEAIELATRQGDGGVESRARLQRWWSHFHLGRPEGSADHAEREALRAIPVLEQLGDELYLAKAWSLRSVADGIRCRSAAAEQACREAIRHASRTGDRNLEAALSVGLAQAAEAGPTPVEEALRQCEETTERVQGDRLAVAQTFTARANLKAMSGRFDEARALVADARAIMEDLGLKTGAYGTGFAMRRAAVELLADDPAAAERELRPICKTLVDRGPSGDKRSLANVALMLAEATYAQGRYSDATRFAEIAETASVGDALAEEAQGRGMRAKLLARQGEFDGAERLAREAVRALDATDLLNDRASRLMDLAGVLLLADRQDEAASVLEDALSLYEQKGNIVSAAKTRILLEEARSAPAR